MQILLSLVKSKIDFHNFEMLSNEERFGRDVAHSALRLAQLRQLHETLRSVCQSAGKAGTRLQVNGWIEIQPVAAAESGSTAVPTRSDVEAPQAWKAELGSVLTSAGSSAS